MKTRINSFLTLCFIALVTMCVSCSEKSKLQQAVEEASKQCPMDLGLVGKISSFSYENKELTIELCMNEGLIKVSTINDDLETAKKSILNSVSTQPDELKDMMSEVVKEKATLVYRYVGDKTKGVAEVRISYDELETALNKTTGDVDFQEELDSQVKIINQQCPSQIDKITTLVNVTMDDESITYHYTIAEESVEMKTLMENVENMKAGLANSIINNMSSMHTFIVACINTNRSLVYHYVGDNSGDDFSVVFSVDELAELAK